MSAAVGRRAPIGLALAGGGPLGAMYEIGALVALDEALEGIDFTELDVYVGVSAGGILAAGLANGITPREMCRLYVESDSDDMPFEPELLLRPALGEYVQRASTVPALVAGALWDYLRHPLSTRAVSSLQQFGRALPTGLFNSGGIEKFLTGLFDAPGRTNDFRRLHKKLYVVATDLDSGASVAFGAAGHDHVPIARAVQASAALPGLYPPVDVDGRYYVDGALKKTLHASVALRHGAKLLLCVNPIVPFDSELAARRGYPRQRRLVDEGLPVVLSQTFRAIIHSRMQVGMDRYAIEYRDADVVLFEPARDDADMFFTNLFSYAGRRRLCEHAYQRTRAELLRRRRELAPILARHGIALRLDVLREAGRTLVPDPPGAAARSGLASVAAELNAQLDELEGALQRWRPRTAKAA